jgi:hypothetical protein
MGRMRRNTWKKVSRIVLTAVVMFTVPSCKKATPPAPEQSVQIAGGGTVSVAGGNSYAHVTYKPEVKIVEKATVDSSIQGIGSDGHGVVFKNAAPEILALKAGDILLVKNAFAAKVLAAETNGDQTVLITDRVGLADVLQQGEIAADNAVTFHGPKVAYAPQLTEPRFDPMGLIETPVYAQGSGLSGIEVEKPTTTIKNLAVDSILQGWKIEKWKVTPADGTANISVRMTKKTNGFNAAVSVDGSITNFQFASQIKFPSPGTQIAAGVKGMSGHMHFVWEIGKDTPGVWAVEDKVKLPAGFSVPLGPIYGGVPLSIDISSAFLIHPALTGGNEYSKGGFTIDWVGSKSAAANAIEAGGAGGSEGLTFAITDDANISPVAPNGMVISFCIPRVELKLALLGSYADSVKLKVAAAAIDAIIDSVASRLLSPRVYKALAASPIGKMSATNVLGSSADVYVQFIHTEGVTHSSNISLAPCTKIELKVTAQAGGDAQLFGITSSGKKNATSTKDLFTKTFTQWKPASNFCKGI